jgi:hypothetical protein
MQCMWCPVGQCPFRGQNACEIAAYFLQVRRLCCAVILRGGYEGYREKREGRRERGRENVTGQAVGIGGDCNIISLSLSSSLFLSLARAPHTLYVSSCSPTADLRILTT